MVGVALCMLFTCNNNSSNIKVILPAALDKKAKQSEQNFLKVADSLTRREKSLQDELSATNLLLGKSKKKNALLTS